jgi:hypothetical protein
VPFVPFVPTVFPPLTTFSAAVGPDRTRRIRAAHIPAILAAFRAFPAFTPGMTLLDWQEQTAANQEQG